MGAGYMYSSVQMKWYFTRPSVSFPSQVIKNDIREKFEVKNMQTTGGIHTSI